MNLNDDILSSFLQKVAIFTKIAVSRVDNLEDKIDTLEVKEAAVVRRSNDLVKRAAQLLYDSDFIQNDYEKSKFLKQAESDPVGTLAKALERVCKAAEVTSIGSPARIAAKPKMAEYDPVAARAFGLDINQSFLD